MKILLLNQFFWPDSAATSQLLTDLARGLAERGHEVTVVCGDSGYANTAAQDAPPVHVHRTRTVPFSRGGLGRVVSYASFLLGAVHATLTEKRVDVVLTLTTPPLLSLIGTLRKALRGTRHWIWEMDVYPDVAVQLGHLRAGSLVERVVGFLADWSRRRSDGVIVLGECMRGLLESHGIDAGLLHVTDNWADPDIEPVPMPNGRQLRVLYSGNLGLAHEVETLRGALPELDRSGEIHFSFRGGGAKRAPFERWCSENDIRNVEFRSYSSRDTLGASLGEGDIGLVTQMPESLGCVVPSKVYGLLAAGRPILFIGPKEAQPGRIIERFRCGWCVEPGDSRQLVELLHILQSNRDQVRDAGMQARHAFLKHFTAEHGVGRIAGLLTGEANSQYFDESALVMSGPSQ